MCSAPESLPLLAEDLPDTLLQETFFSGHFDPETQTTTSAWLPPTTVSLDQLTYDSTPFLTPYASTAADSSPFPRYSTATHLSPFPIYTHSVDTSAFPQFGIDPTDIPARPQSSPSTFCGPKIEDLVWAGNALRIRSSAADDVAFPPATYEAVDPSAPLLGAVNSSDVIAPSPKRAWTAIAPDPAGLTMLTAQKRKREEEEAYEVQTKRRRSTSTTLQVGDLGEEERFLLRLKEEENLPWKDIAVRFQTDMGKNYQVPALQMRFKRLRERLRVWSEVDINALHQAYEYWDKYKFEIIGAKMVDFGSSEKWPARFCARKWQELHPTYDYPRNQISYTTSATSTPEAILSHTPYMA